MSHKDHTCDILGVYLVCFVNPLVFQARQGTCLLFIRIKINIFRNFLAKVKDGSLEPYAKKEEVKKGETVEEDKKEEVKKSEESSKEEENVKKEEVKDEL